MRISSLVESGTGSPYRGILAAEPPVTRPHGGPLASTARVTLRPLHRIPFRGPKRPRESLTREERSLDSHLRRHPHRVSGGSAFTARRERGEARAPERGPPPRGPASPGRRPRTGARAKPRASGRA